MKPLNFLTVLSALLLMSAPALAQGPPQIQTGTIANGAVTPAKLAAGGTTPSSTVYYRGDGTWQTVSGGTVYIGTAPISVSGSTISVGTASSSALGVVKIGSGIVEAGDGTISVSASSSGGFVPGSATAPSFSLYPGYYLGTTEYVAAHASWISNSGGASVPLEGGGALYYQTSTTGSSYTGPDGTSGTYYVGKGSDVIVGVGITSGSIYVKAFDVNAAGSLSTGVTASSPYAAPPGTGAGTVTSVAISLPGIFTVTGSPITTSGTLSAALATQSANTVFAGPSSGGAAAPTFRSLVAADIPALTHTTISDFSSTVDSLLSATSPLTYNSSTGAFGLGAVGSAGTYGTATAYPIFTLDAYGRVISVTTQTVSGGFTPASVSAPSTVVGAISDYSGTTAYTTWQANFSADVAGEAGGDTQWQWSTDGATWMGPGGTSATWYYVKGSHWRDPVGYTSGNLYAQARNVNATGSVSGAVSSASLAYATLGAGSPFGVTIVTSLPTPSSAYRGRLVVLSGQPTAGSAYYTANTALTSLKNWWRMNDASGSAMTDVIGSRNGTYTAGDTYHQAAPDSDTGAYSVTAATTTGNVLAGTVASGTNAWAGTGGNTIVAWVNCYGTLPATASTNYGIGVGSGNAAGNGFCLQFSGGSGSNAGVGAYVIAGSSVTQAPSAAPYYVTFPNTGWQMLSATLDGTNLKLYIDGALSSTTAYAGYFTSTPTVFNIAPGKGVGVSEVSTYNAALTLAQIQSLYNAGNGIGTDDKFYVCIEQAAGTYAWKYMTLN